MNKNMFLRIELVNSEISFTVINILKSVLVLSPNSNTTVDYFYIPTGCVDFVKDSGILNGMCLLNTGIRFILEDKSEIVTDPGDSIELPMIGFPKDIRILGPDNGVKVIIHVPEPTRSANGSGITMPGQMPVLIKQS